MRGLRFYLIVDDFVLDDAPAMAKRIAPFGWHLQVQNDGNWMPDALPILSDLPVDVVIDHVGRTPPENGVDDPGFQSLLKFMETGRCWVKISGLYRAGPLDLVGRDGAAVVQSLLAANPERVIWGSDWPHTPPHDDETQPDARPSPFRNVDTGGLLDLLLDWIPAETVRHRVLVENPATLYGFTG